MLTRFDLPKHTTAISFFFQARIGININGFISETVNQQRDLRQRDSLSSILFSLTIEPLIQCILTDDTITGITPVAKMMNIMPISPETVKLKVLAYADDLLIFLNNLTECRQLMAYLEVYRQASNGKLNVFKSQVLFLRGNAINHD
jgi:hypothetical protein